MLSSRSGVVDLEDSRVTGFREAPRLGAALQATERVPVGCFHAPGQRYHPAVIAQAIGTLSSMYPGRFWAALGTGEASNEHITGDSWPAYSKRLDKIPPPYDITIPALITRSVRKVEPILPPRCRDDEVG